VDQFCGGGSEIRRRVDEALDTVDLLDLAERRPSQLSGGQQQRVALARTIVIRPRVLLLDEPLSNLDANLRIQMRHEIHSLQRQLGLTTVFVTHDQEEANTMADRIAVLNDKILQQVGPPMALYDNPSNLFVAEFLGTTNAIPGAVRGGMFTAEGGIQVPAPGAPADGRVLVFRPQNALLVRADAASVGGSVRLSGQVSHTEFLGSIIRYTVQVGPHRVLVDEQHRTGTRQVAQGEQVALHLEPSQTVILAA
jgi:iron(III) transport system ATP-binding protein